MVLERERERESRKSEKDKKSRKYLIIGLGAHTLTVLPPSGPWSNLKIKLDDK